MLWTCFPILAPSDIGQRLFRWSKACGENTEIEQGWKKVEKIFNFAFSNEFQKNEDNISKAAGKKSILFLTTVCFL